MTLDSTTSKVQYTQAGTTTEWPVTFKFLDNEDLIVITTVDGVDTTLVLDTDYSVTGAGDDAGGTVIISPAVASGTLVTIYRVVDLDQQTQLTTAGGWYPKVHEAVFDRLTMQIQQVQEQADRSLKIGVTDTRDPEDIVDDIFEARDDAQTAAAAAEDSAIRAEVASSTVAYYNHEGTLGIGEDTITLPWAYDTTVGVEVYLSGIKQTESVLTFTDAYTVTLDEAVSAITPFEVVASAGAKGDLAKPSGSGGVGFLQDGTGASARTVQAKLRDFVSVKDFGAVGDGVTDDTAAIQAAIDYAVSSGIDGVIFPQGIYLSGQVSVSNGQDGVNIVGSGATLLYNDAGDACIKITGNRSRLHGLKIKPASTVSAGKPLVLFGNASYFNSVTECYISGSSAAGVGIRFEVTENGNYWNTVSDCFLQTLDKGIVFDAGANANIVSNTQFHYITTAGVETSGYNQITSCNIEQSDGASFFKLLGENAAICAVNCNAEFNSLNGYLAYFDDAAINYTRSVFHFARKAAGKVRTATIDTSALASCPFILTVGTESYGIMRHTGPMTINGASSAGEYLYFTSTGTAGSPDNYRIYKKYVGAGLNVLAYEYQLDSAVNTWTPLANMRRTDFTSGEDNFKNLGTASERWATVYAGAGAINTSDKREKSDARDLSISEQRVAKQLKKMVRAFRFNSAVAEKGDDARTHFGLMAQDVGDAFRAEGLDPHMYALFCYDEWGEERDENGNVVRKAGNRYGIRYDELFAFIISAV